MAKTQGKVLMNFEVTPEQRDQIRENAAWFGMKTAEFMRYATLGPVVERPSGGRS
jgi:hypothetical protein